MSIFDQDKAILYSFELETKLEELAKWIADNEIPSPMLTDEKIVGYLMLHLNANRERKQNDR